jgi:hypothetical protein
MSQGSFKLSDMRRALKLAREANIVVNSITVTGNDGTSITLSPALDPVVVVTEVKKKAD